MGCNGPNGPIRQQATMPHGAALPGAVWLLGHGHPSQENGGALRFCLSCRGRGSPEVGQQVLAV
jgi:hypothetical protein